VESLVLGLMPRCTRANMVSEQTLRILIVISFGKLVLLFIIFSYTYIHACMHASKQASKQIEGNRKKSKQ
jgi:hypothetical protein